MPIEFPLNAARLTIPLRRGRPPSGCWVHWVPLLPDRVPIGVRKPDDLQVHFWADLTEGLVRMSGFAERTLGEVLTALASDAASPGSGAAAAIAMAFSAACAGKALAISRKHRPPDESLQRAERELASIVRRALAQADTDAKLFEQFIHHRSADSAAKLVHADASSQDLATELGRLLDQIAEEVDPVVRGDIAAARALLAAVNTIEARIRAENEREARR